MERKERKLLAARLRGLSLFRGVLETGPFAALCDLLEAEDPLNQLALLGEVCSGLTPWEGDFCRFLREKVFEDENPVIKAKAAGKTVSEALEANCRKDLYLFSMLSALKPEDLCPEYEDIRPVFVSEPVDFAAEYEDRLANVAKHGYGIFAGAGMLRLDDAGNIVPVESPDAITLDSFIGYEYERGRVLSNTKALLEGRPAANMLLYGDAGTGKSSTIKAVANALRPEGLRLIELRKDQLLRLSSVMGRIAGNPLKFIIFIDDLSFNKNDSDFSMLKAALEGSASVKADNAVIYATSNRRHIVKESFSDRTAMDDVHINDTMQELMSLSDRFGETVYFQKPNKQLYLQIVTDLARKAGLDLPESELAEKAEAYALRKGSRSARAAEQFVDSLR
ncbi:MAG: ATP-binding protein [Firmicutes bacterium]|nr:ATP-binding protein [Bacillota bacterium]MBR0050498.1 ATP-binding protein [Bacillota bacterium]MBR0210496.1 ATP-binding protein [Bacillota bacterium]